MNYILELDEKEYGCLSITFPKEITDELNWSDGDILEWDSKGSGLLLTKLNDPKGYEVHEE